MESGNYAAVQIATALASNHIKLVPEIQAAGGGDQGSLIKLIFYTIVSEVIDSRHVVVLKMV
jgi:hypothetical protein